MIKSKLENIMICRCLLILLLGFTISCNSDPFPKTILPIHPDAISITKKNNAPTKGAKSVFYYIEDEFPANGIISFYNHELSSMGYLPFDVKFESRPLQNWSRFNPKSGEFEIISEPPGRYVAHWSNESMKTWVWLVISSGHEVSDKYRKTRFEVSCNMAKLSAYEESLRQIQKMESDAHNKANSADAKSRAAD